jgi:hypothetical protein
MHELRAQMVSQTDTVEMGCNPDFTIQDSILLKYNGTSASVVVPNNIDTIGTEAFAGMEFLEEIIFSDSVIEIQDRAFESCTRLKQIDVPGRIYRIGTRAFFNCNKLIKVKLPLGLRIIANNAFQNCIGLSEIELPQGLRFIGENAFRGCTALQKIEIPSSVHTIEAEAFCRSGIISAKVPDSISADMEYLAFQGSPFGNHDSRSIRWDRKRLCRHCGGKLNLHSQCEECGINRDIDQP